MTADQYLIGRVCLQWNSKYVNDPELIGVHNSNNQVPIQILRSNFECMIHFYELQIDGKESKLDLNCQ